MNILSNQNKNKILELITKLGRGFFIGNKINIINEYKKTHPTPIFCWDNPENIESGLSGIAILFIETYRTTNQKQYYDVAKAIINEIIVFCRTNRTNNYSLYTGRCGAAYAIFQFYKISREIHLINEAVDIIKPAKVIYVNSEFVTDSLYDGRAGTLLMFFCLYQITNDSTLLDDICLFTEKIIDNIKLNKEGIYWENNEDFNNKTLMGFAKGKAGISFVLNQINDILPTEITSYLNIKLTLYEELIGISNRNNYENLIREIKYQNILKDVTLHPYHMQNLNKSRSDFSWSHGTTGIGFKKISNKEDVSNIVKVLYKGIIKDQISDNSLYNGLAGVGCFFVEASKQLSEKKYFKIALEIGDKLLVDLSNKKDLNDGLFYGDVGSLYFLLSLIEPKVEQESLLCPLSRRSNNKAFQLQKIRISAGTLRQKILNKYFPRTCQIIQQCEPQIIEEFCINSSTELSINEINAFIAFIDYFLESTIETPISLPLIDLFHLEKNKYELMITEERTKAQLFSEGRMRHKRVVELMNSFDDKLLDKMIIRSDKILVINTKWNWYEMDEYFNKKELIHNLSKIPGNFETMLRITDYNETIENVLSNAEPFCWHWFQNKSTIRYILQEVTNYCDKLGEEELHTNIAHFGSKDALDFKDTLQYLHLSTIKEWLYEGILLMEY